METTRKNVRGPYNVEAAVDLAAKFGQLYALLDTIRETSRRAEQLGGMILEQRDLKRVERVSRAANEAIGEVLCAQKRMLFETGITRE